MVNNLKISVFSALILIILTSCGGLQRSGIDQPVNADDRVKEKLKEGKGLRLKLGDDKAGVIFNFILLPISMLINAIELWAFENICN